MRPLKVGVHTIRHVENEVWFSETLAPRIKEDGRQKCRPYFFSANEIVGRDIEVRIANALSSWVMTPKK